MRIEELLERMNVRALIVEREIAREDGGGACAGLRGRGECCVSLKRRDLGFERVEFGEERLEERGVGSCCGCCRCGSARNDRVLRNETGAE